MPQKSSETPERKGGAAKKTRGQREWLGVLTHPPEVADATPSPGASPIHEGSVPHRPGRPDPFGGWSSGSSRPGSSPAADRCATRIRPDWSVSPSPLPSPSSPAPKLPSSLSPLSPTRPERSSDAEWMASAADESEDGGGENEGALFKNLRPVPYIESLSSG